MRTRSAQKPTSTALARRQQPTDSTVAALPTETVQHIVELALEEEDDPFELQSIKSSLRAVCFHWYTVVGPPIEYALSSGRAAARLAAQLESVNSGQDIRSLHLSLDPRAPDHHTAEQAATLLQRCPNVERLNIDLDQPPCWTAFGRDSPLLDSMSELKNLEVVDLRSETYLTSDVLEQLFQAWPKLHTLSTSTRHYYTRDPRPARDYTRALASLRRLEVTSNVDLIHNLLVHIPDPQKLTSVIISERQEDDDELARLLVKVAPGLEHFSAPSGWNPGRHLPYLLDHMVNIRTLELPTGVFDRQYSPVRLQKLVNLRQLSFVGSENSTAFRLRVRQLLRALPSSLERFCLSRRLRECWTEEQLTEVEEIARAMEVKLKWI